MKLEVFLLRLYPREWRARYEDEFMALLEQARSSPLDMADMALGALDAHLRPQVTAASVGIERRRIMSRATFIQWSGMAAMAGTVLLLLGVVAASIFSDYPYYHTPGVEDLAASALELAGAGLMLIGALGFGSAYARRTGGLGQGGLLITILGLSSLTLGFVGSVMEKLSRDLPGWAGMVIAGLSAMFVGMALFATASLRPKLLAIPTALLVLVSGVWAATVLLLSLSPFRSSESTFMLLGGITFIGLVLYLVGFFLIGRALWHGRGPAVRPAEPTSVR
jgi:hypothetical protein